MTARLVLVATSSRVPPGQLTWPAWRVLRTARVLAPGDHPQVAALRAAEVPVEQVDATDVQGLLAALVAAAAGSTHIAWLLGGAGPCAADLEAAWRTRVGTEVEVVDGSSDLPGSALLDLVAVMDRLRSPGGCPWDAEQTHDSLVPYLVEEAFETVEAIETGDDAALLEELGDLLLQVVFHARIAQEAPGGWSVDDVAEGIVAKLVRRHPHVFADVEAPTADQVEASWERLKAAEKQRASAVDGVPLAQPALALAARLQARAGRAGVPAPPDPESLARARAALEGARSADDLGELLLALVAVAAQHDWDAEAALRAAARRYADRVRAVELGRDVSRS